MTHHLALSGPRARILRWCERRIDTDLVAVWSPEDKQTLAGLVMDGLVMPTGSRYQLTPDGVMALQHPDLSLHDPHTVLPTEAQWDAMMEAAAPTTDYPPGDPDE